MLGEHVAGAQPQAAVSGRFIFAMILVPSEFWDHPAWRECNGGPVSSRGPVERRPLPAAVVMSPDPGGSTGAESCPLSTYPISRIRA